MHYYLLLLQIHLVLNVRYPPPVFVALALVVNPLIEAIPYLPAPAAPVLEVLIKSTAPTNPSFAVVPVASSKLLPVPEVLFIVTYLIGPYPAPSYPIISVVIPKSPSEVIFKNLLAAA